MLVPLLTPRRHEHERVVRQVDFVRAYRAGVKLGRARSHPECARDAERKTRDGRVRTQVCQLVGVETDAEVSARTWSSSCHRGRECEREHASSAASKRS